MDPLVKQILNSLRCPLCQGRIDLLGWQNKRPGTVYNFCCINDWEHYRLFFVHWESPPYIDYELITVYENRKKYEITQYLSNKTEIHIFEIDAENRVVEGGKKTTFTYDKKLFDFTRTNREKLVNRVKTILLFQ